MDKQTQQELNKIVKHNYATIAQSFATTRQKQIWPRLASLAAEVKDQESVLDVGCGSGRLLTLFQDRTINYVGLDNCPELLEIAQQEFAAGPNQPQFVCGDILNLSAVTQINFDHVFCIAVLHHLPDQQQRVAALKQLKNKIGTDGRIILTVWNLWAQSKYRKLIIKFWILKLLKKNKMDFGDILFTWKDPQVTTYTQRYYHAFTEKQLKDIVAQAGLQLASLDKDDYNYYLVLKK